MERVPEHLEAAEVFLTVDCGIANHAELKELVEKRGGSPGHRPPHAQRSPAPRGGPPPRLHPRAWASTPRGPGWPSSSSLPFTRGLACPLPLEYADLAALGTIADVAPLWGWNRALAKEGLARMATSAWVGLRLLAQAVGLHGQGRRGGLPHRPPASTRQAAWGRRKKALKLLLTDSEEEARELVEELNRLNARRQTIEEAMLRRLLPQVDPEERAHRPFGTRRGTPGSWASWRAAFWRPPLGPSSWWPRGRGTVRSLAPISAVEALKSVEDLLKRFGGHREAAGFAMDEALFPELKRRLLEYAARFPEPELEVPLLAPLPAPGLLAQVYRELELLKPYGAGNPEPLFLLQGSPEEARTMGEGRHLAFRLQGVRVVAWRMGGLAVPREVEVAGLLTENAWNGSVSYEVQAVHLREPGELEGGLTAFAFPLKLEEALARARIGEGVYIPGDNPEGLEYARKKGFRLLPPEEAPIWLGLPPNPVAVERVEVALGREARARLASPPILATPAERLKSLIARRLLLAYERGHAPLFSEALLAYWEVYRVQAAAGSP
jgi:single-stranded-DNA-specific exonuclease